MVPMGKQDLWLFPLAACMLVEGSKVRPRTPSRWTPGLGYGL